LLGGDMSREQSEERLTDLVGHAMCGGDFQPLSDELAAMRAVAVKIAQTSDDNPSVGLLAAIVADLSYIVGSAMAFHVQQVFGDDDESST
jgi:hypothetical protein